MTVCFLFDDVQISHLDGFVAFICPYSFITATSMKFFRVIELNCCCVFKAQVISLWNSLDLRIVCYLGDSVPVFLQLVMCCFRIILNFLSWLECSMWQWSKYFCPFLSSKKSWKVGIFGYILKSYISLITTTCISNVQKSRKNIINCTTLIRT